MSIVEIAEQPTLSFTVSCNVTTSSIPLTLSAVNVGDKIGPGNVLCVIEAMKLFNEIEAEVSGKIVKILIDDASPIEYDQPLFLVEPM